VGATAAAGLGAVIEKSYLPSWLGPVVTLLQTFTTLLRSHERMIRIAGYMLISNGLTILSFWMCCRSLGIGLNFWDAGIILQGMVLAATIPVSIGGWGLREGAAVALFAGLGIGGAEAVGAAVLLGGVLTCLGIFGALVWAQSSYRRFDRAAGFEQFKRGAAAPDQQS
jgi:glycosyltransferase 2 family protein